MKHYALYKGDEFIAMGNIYQLAKIRNVDIRTIKFFSTPTYKKRCVNSKKRLILIEID